jgi:hypothetical protein
MMTRKQLRNQPMATQHLPRRNGRSPPIPAQTLKRRSEGGRFAAPSRATGVAAKGGPGPDADIGRCAKETVTGCGLLRVTAVPKLEGDRGERRCRDDRDATHCKDPLPPGPGPLCD